MPGTASPLVVRFGLGALVLAVLGGVAAVVDKNWAIALYYPVAAFVIAVATIGLTGVAGSIGMGLARLITASLVGINLVFAFLLAFATMMCACSRQVGSPITPEYLVIHGLHMAGAFGGAALLAAAAVVQAKAELATIRLARMVEGPADRVSSALRARSKSERRHRRDVPVK